MKCIFPLDTEGGPQHLQEVACNRVHDRGQTGQLIRVLPVLEPAGLMDNVGR